MKKYKTTSYNMKITEVECERETNSSVWVEEEYWGKEVIRRHQKKGSFEEYHDSFEEAKKCIIARVQDEIDSANDALESAQKRMKEAQAIKS